MAYSPADYKTYPGVPARNPRQAEERKRTPIVVENTEPLLLEAPKEEDEWSGE